MAAGDFFGEIAALTGSLRTADVVADVDTTLLEVPAEALRAHDGRAGDPARRPVDDDQPAAADRGRRPAAPGRASTRTTCATCARRGRQVEALPRTY